MKITIENMDKEQDKYLRSVPKGQEIWCTELSLGNILKSLFPGKEIIHNKIWKESGSNIRPDYRIPELKIVVEYQGPRHYTEIATMNRDVYKKAVCIELGYKCIEFPYFVQPTIKVLCHLFGYLSTLKDYSNGFPHGFIHPSAIPLTDFSLNGLILAKEVFATFPTEVTLETWLSLEHRAKLLQIPMQIYNPLHAMVINTNKLCDNEVYIDDYVHIWDNCTKCPKKLCSYDMSSTPNQTPVFIGHNFEIDPPCTHNYGEKDNDIFIVWNSEKEESTGISSTTFINCISKLLNWSNLKDVDRAQLSELL